MQPRARQPPVSGTMHVPCHKPLCKVRATLPPKQVPCQCIIPLQGRGGLWHGTCMAHDDMERQLDLLRGWLVTCTVPVPDHVVDSAGLRTCTPTLPSPCRGRNGDRDGLPLPCPAIATVLVEVEAQGLLRPLCRAHYHALHEHVYARTVPRIGHGDCIGAGPCKARATGEGTQAACHEAEAAPGQPRHPDTPISETTTTTTSIGQSPCTNFSAPVPELSDAPSPIRGLLYHTDPINHYRPLQRDTPFVLDPACPEAVDLDAFVAYYPNPDVVATSYLSDILRRFRTLTTRILNAFKEF